MWFGFLYQHILGLWHWINGDDKYALVRQHAFASQKDDRTKQPWIQCTPVVLDCVYHYRRPQDSINPTDSLVGELWRADGRRTYAKGKPDISQVTVKILRAVKIDPKAPHNVSVDRLCKRLMDEAKLLKDNRHRNIAPIIAYRVGESLFDKVIVTPWYNNGNLPAWTKIRQPDLNLKLILLKTLAEALVFLSKRNIFHGDIKPENILVDDESQAIITDFGLYTIFQEGIIINPNDFRPTSSGGSNVRWSSPARLRLEEFTPADDTYSFGCIVLYVLTGLEPYHKARSVAEFWRYQLAGAPPSSPELQPGSKLPESSRWWSIMKSCWLPATIEDVVTVPTEQEVALRPPMETIYAEVVEAVKESVGT